MSGVLSLQPSYYEALKRLTLELAGITLGDDHTFLVETRLSALARKEGFESLPQMIDQLFSKGQTRLAVQVVSALLERASSFFEDRPSYNTLTETIIPALYPRYRGGRLRILVYGCSSGQEVYSTAIHLNKFADVFPDINFDLVGVDYPSLALERARQGRFTHFEVQRGLPIRDLIENFDRINEDWLVMPRLCENIEFQDHNLMSDTAALGTFHVVLFRRKLSQFSPAAAVRIMRRLNSLTVEQGFLLLGTDEALGNSKFGFDTVDGLQNCYQKRVQEEKPLSEEELAQIEAEKRRKKGGSIAPVEYQNNNVASRQH